MAVATAGGELRDVSPREMRRVVVASSLGTIFEWYDVFLYGALAVIIGKHFFTGLSDSAQFIFALLTFAAGFLMRPFGAVVFGRLGDIFGRRITFLIAITLMGLSTFIVGILPSYTSIGMAAPVILIGLRLLQGLALGGEYGGAAIYVAEHADSDRRGFTTSWIHATAALGLFLALVVILLCRQLSPGDDIAAREASFAAEWGAWRIPFLVSLGLLVLSVWIRMTLNESPLFEKMKEEGRTSQRPLGEAFAEWSSLRLVILALIGLTAGQAVVWYTGQFYALFFLTQTLKVDPHWANIMLVIALAIGTPFFIVFGWLSDMIGRKPIILAGCLLAAFTYFPIFKMITQYANPQLAAAVDRAPVVVIADPAECRLQFDPVGRSKFTAPCDVAKSALVKAGVPYVNVAGPSGAAEIRIGESIVPAYDGAASDATQRAAAFQVALTRALESAGYPPRSRLTGISVPVVALLTLLTIYVTMVYGPLAAMLVEMFPTRYRYSAMSLPYHVGAGWFGGLMPTAAFAIVASSGDIYSGLWYPIVIALMTFVVGMFFVRETLHKELDREEI